MSTFAYTAATAALDAILVEEANHISPDIRRRTLGRSPWVDLLPRGKFASGQGYQINKLIYERALPKYESTPASGTYNTTGVKFSSFNSTALATDNTNIATGTLAGAHTDARGIAYNAARIDFAQQLKQCSPEFAPVFSPYFDLSNLYFHTQLTEQVDAIVAALGDATHWCWEQRFRSEYIKKSKNLVICKSASTAIQTTYVNAAAATVSFEGSDITDLDQDASSNAQTPTARLSNAVLDLISARRQAQGRSDTPWGMQDGVEVDALVASAEAIRRLKTEPGYRDDYRYSSFANDLLKPFGVNETHRGWALIKDYSIPRYNASGGLFVEVPRETFDSDGISVIPNSAYDSATYEIAVLLHKDVLENKFLDPNVNGGGGVVFDAQNFMGQFQWLNIKDQVANPFGTNGRFGGILASATMPIKTDFGYIILFDRTSATYAE